MKGLVPVVECEPDSGSHTAYDAESKKLTPGVKPNAVTFNLLVNVSENA